ncbi:hypothetical protein [Sulfurimonas sp.]|uniref:hypothetical protein n=1 Tax=Sulfurimonas sp. TaxID=2022749 RepID=UPI003565A7D1
MQEKIYYLNKEAVDNDIFFKNVLCLDTTNNYYWSDDWSEEFYIKLAYSGFISTSLEVNNDLVLLPELQFDYAVLDFEDLHISKKLQKLLNSDRYIFSQNTNFDEVLDQIDKLHEHNWLKGKYRELLTTLFEKNDLRDNFKVYSYEVLCSKTNKLIAGEVGYKTGNIYTSLSGFSLREKEFNNFGTLQLVLLGKHLEKEGYAFWNLGHPHMDYKKQLGAKVYSRDEFLKRFESSI